MRKKFKFRMTISLIMKINQKKLKAKKINHAPHDTSIYSNWKLVKRGKKNIDSYGS
jgi:hypothetical protein